MNQELNHINWPVYKIIDVLQDFFALDSKYTFRIEDQLSKVYIREKNAVRLESSDDTPIIAVARGPIRSQNRFIGDCHSIDGTSGTYYHMDILDSNITVSCLSPVGLEAEELASMVFGVIKFNRDDIMNLGFFRVDPPVITEEQIIRSNSDYELVNVSVVFNIQYVIKWSRQETTRLVGFNMRIRNVNQELI